MEEFRDRSQLTEKEIITRASDCASAWVGKKYHYDEKGHLKPDSPEDNTYNDYHIALAVAAGYRKGVDEILRRLSYMSIQDMIASIAGYKDRHR